MFNDNIIMVFNCFKGKNASGLAVFMFLCAVQQYYSSTLPLQKDLKKLG